MPYESVLAQGYAYKEASHHPNKPIVLLGMWLLLGHHCWLS